MSDEAEQLAEQAALTWTVPAGWTAGDVGECRSCGATIMWCTTPRDKRSPINPDGVSHFATCPQAEQWRKR